MGTDPDRFRFLALIGSTILSGVIAFSSIGCGSAGSSQPSDSSTSTGQTSGVAAAKPIPQDLDGLVLRYQSTYGTPRRTGQVVVARANDGRESNYTHDLLLIYDGERTWSCKLDKPCASRVPKGNQSQRVFDYLTLGYFDAFSKDSIRYAATQDWKPVQGRKVAGVDSECRSGTEAIGEGGVTLCAARYGGFMTLLQAPDANTRLIEKTNSVAPALLERPTGAWDGQIPED